MNKLNKVLFRLSNVAIYLLIVMTIIGFLIGMIVIPQWVKSTEILVPNLVGKDYWQAVDSLGNIGLKPDDIIQESNSNEPKGKIITQDPPANFSIKPHHKVKLTVSIGTDLSLVPSVIGKSIDAAYETLQTAGFQVNTSARVHSSQYLPDIVIAQSPAENSKYIMDTEIHLLVSKGRKAQNIELPDLTGQPLNDVLHTLQELGMDVDVNYSPHPTIPTGNIIGHKRFLQIGDQITLNVSGQRNLTENTGRWLKHKHTVTEIGNLAKKIEIMIVDAYSERKMTPVYYSPGTVIDLEKMRIRVFGPTLVIVFEDGKKVAERQYQ
ncbi:PASTA domain-containing protein [Candidatus Poribacteria bacterium]|nr:PASTA domain-containing protein [Candidatus Poribacteria bacterium]